MLFEGAQGAMLDVDLGTYPYVTSSNTINIVFLAARGSGHVDLERPIAFVNQENTPLAVRFHHGEGIKIRLFGRLNGSVSTILSPGPKFAPSSFNTWVRELGLPVFQSTIETEGNCVG